MAISISGSAAISGLSGMDTDFDSVLDKLYAVEKTQLNQLQAWKSDWQLRYDAFNTVIDQMSAAKSMLAAIGSTNSFVTKNAVSSDEKVLTALASGSAQDGQHKIVVSQMASNAIWCNTGAVFEEKSDIINKTGGTVTFAFDYAGKHYSYDIAANTTLESFVSLINNASDNPGINVSLINTGEGYVFQIAGRSTGEKNSLTIYSCGLEGMDASRSTSVWRTDAAIDPDAAVTNPTSYAFTATLNSGTKINFTLKGDATDADLVTALNSTGGTGLINASIDASGNLVMGNVQSLTRRATSESAYKPGGLTLNVGSDLGGAIIDENSTDVVTVTVAMDDGNSRTFSINGSATKQQFVDQLKQSLESTSRLGLTSQGGYEVKLDHVTGITLDGGRQLSDLGLSSETYEAQGTPDALTSLTSVAGSSLLTFAQDTFTSTSRIDGKTDGSAGEALTYTLVTTSGRAIYVDKDANGNALDGSMSMQDLYAAIKKAIDDDGGSYTEGTDDSGNTTLELNDIKNFYLSSGAVSSSGVSFERKLTTTLDTSFFATQDSQGNPITDGEGNPIRVLETPPDLTYTIMLNDGGSYSVTKPSGSSLSDIVQALSEELAQAGSSATIGLVDSEGNPWVDAATSGEAFIQAENIQSLTGSGFLGQIVSSSNWRLTNASNAIYEVDNWPMKMQSQSNTITDLLDGVSLTLQGVGEANISVSTDVASVEKSIQNFLDAVNSVLLTIRELTKVDEDKEKTSNDPNDIGNSNYSKSTLTAEIGGLLTGNYGVQLVKSRFLSVVTTAPPGFQAMASADDLLSGDMLSCLSNLGIKTDTDSTSETYGLLVIAPRSDFLQQMDSENYEDMINNHVNELVEFFVSSGIGTSTSPAFRYNSHISGITEAGTYDVSYDVDSNGQISNVTIGGEACIRDESRGGYYYTCASGAARGMAISIDDLSEGTHTGQVRIKQGLVQTVKSFLDKELTFNDINISTNAPESVISAQISLKSENGAMMTLKSNYNTIMSNIDKSIEKEQTRLQSWYNRQKNVFANLETMLQNLNQQQEQLESQLAQLS